MSPYQEPSLEVLESSTLCVLLATLLFGLFSYHPPLPPPLPPLSPNELLDTLILLIFAEEFSDKEKLFSTIVVLSINLLMTAILAAILMYPKMCILFFYFYFAFYFFHLFLFLFFLTGRSLCIPKSPRIRDLMYGEEILQKSNLWHIGDIYTIIWSPRIRDLMYGWLKPKSSWTQNAEVVRVISRHHKLSWMIFLQIVVRISPLFNE